jgi:P4 family phage/plasmid primase-like protien
MAMAVFGYVGKFTGNEDLIWKTEGATDAAAIMSLILACEPPPNHTAVCNACGSEESPVKEGAAEWVKQMAGKEVLVIHDCDKPGQRGATWVTNVSGRKRPGWAPAIAQHAAVVRNVVLPFEMNENHGKDVRDWIIERLNDGKPRAAIYAELLEYARSQPTIEKLAETAIKDIEQDDDGEISQGEEADDDSDDETEPILEGEDDPHRLARVNLDQYRDKHDGHLVFWCSEWWKYRHGQYKTIEISSLKAKVNATIRREFEARWRENEERRLARELATGEEIKREPIRKVTSGLVTNVIEAMQSMCSVSDSIEMPCWLPDRSKPNIVSLKNGLLDLDALFAGKDESECMKPHCREWFSRVQFPYEFDRNATCPIWVQFLEDAFNGDRESIDALQMWFGYLLTQDTSLQKLLMVIGKPRCGKGTISRTLNAMLGKDSVCTPTLGNLAIPTELHGLVGKSVALINETRLSDRADRDVITERILSIVGEDSQDIQRKYLTTLHSVKLALRFTMFANQIPPLNDSSSAIVKRCLVLVMPNTYYGKEDLSLSKKLLAELPGIFLWAIAGRKMLNDVGTITQPKSGAGIVSLFKSIASPVSVFVESECVEGEGLEIPTRELFDHWCNWCRENDYDQKLTIQQFSKKLRDVIPELKTVRPRTEFGRERRFAGISILRGNNSDDDEI